MGRVIRAMASIFMIGLAGAFLWSQSVLILRPSDADGLYGVSDVEKKEASQISVPTLVQSHQEAAQSPRVESELSVVSSSGSVKPLLVTTIPKAVHHQDFCVKGLKDKASSVYVAVFESADGFPKAELSGRTFVVPAIERQVSFSLELPIDQPIAVAVFQDIDGNGILSKNQFGIPIEPYGFSNDVRGNFGPPSFRQAAFAISPDGGRSSVMEITLR